MKYGGLVLCFVLAVVYGKFTAGGTSYQLPEEITFQVYVAFDNVLHTHFSNAARATQYASVFFNAINLHFREMRNPRIKFEVVMFHGQNYEFTKPALTLDHSQSQVDATASLDSLYNFTRTRKHFEPSDIVFVFSGRKVYRVRTDGHWDYYPQGLTWDGGICNASRKFIIVSDIGKQFSALPNAGFQLSRLLGAPAACTPDSGKLEGNFVPFVLTDCAMDGIRKFLQNIVKDDPHRAKECFRRRYNVSISQYFNGLPSSMVDEDALCKSSEKFAKDYGRRGRCEVLRMLLTRTFSYSSVSDDVQ
ncbi:uncharacterized protein LOC135385697 [Ornithodoros turicata]|uniref:uncharacterized protein LOC135385697 n=1 Tax=Ornithodoros turicata TaxID=34597 RepID=UPI0031390DE8